MGAATTDPKLGTVVDGYRIDERIGAGGMGIVYGGVRTSDGAKVALKFLHESFALVPDLVKRFDREAAAMRLVEHERLVAILDAGVANGVPYLVMERLIGRSLGELTQEGALPILRAIEITRQLLAGVGAAHERNVVHRDLKPDNVFLVEDAAGECVKILDFGLAKILHDNGASVLTQAGFALGTPSYMSPEQANGTPSDHRTDVYAVGVILYQMIVGKKPFVAESQLAVLRMQCEDTPIPPSKAAPGLAIPAQIERAILRALEKDPAARWQSAAAFARALDEDDSTRRAKRGSEATPLPRPASSRPRTLGYALVAVALVATVGALAWNQLRMRSLRVDAPPPVPSTATAKRTNPALAPAIVDATSVGAATKDDDETDDDVAPTDTPGAALESAAGSQATDAQPLHFATARDLVLAGKTDEGIQLLYRLRHRSPRSAEIGLWLGHAYFRKLWRTDGLREYAAVALAHPAARRDAQMLRNAVVGLEDPTYRLARAVIEKRIGKAALPELRRASHEAKNPRVRARAAMLAAELGHPRQRRR